MGKKKPYLVTYDSVFGGKKSRLLYLDKDELIGERKIAKSHGAVLRPANKGIRKITKR